MVHPRHVKAVGMVGMADSKCVHVSFGRELLTREKRPGIGPGLFLANPSRPERHIKINRNIIMAEAFFKSCGLRRAETIAVKRHLIIALPAQRAY